MNSETQSSENNTTKDEIPTPATVIVPVAHEKRQGGVKGMHKGHQYSIDCKCAICKRATAKNIQLAHEKAQSETAAAENKKQIIQEFISTLPSDRILIGITDESFDLLQSKVEVLKQKYSGMNYADLMQSLANDSLTHFLKTL